jgi:hypothetical protein
MHFFSLRVVEDRGWDKTGLIPVDRWAPSSFTPHTCCVPTSVPLPQVNLFSLTQVLQVNLLVRETCQSHTLAGCWVLNSVGSPRVTLLESWLTPPVAYAKGCVQTGTGHMSRVCIISSHNGQLHDDCSNAHTLWFLNPEWISQNLKYIFANNYRSTPRYVSPSTESHISFHITPSVKKYKSVQITKVCP